MAKKTGKDLLEAAERIDYDGILACLEDGVPGSFVGNGALVKGTRPSPIARILASVNKPEFRSNNAAACIKLLHEHGADLNYPAIDGYPLDYVGTIHTDDSDERSAIGRNIHDAVAYVVTHGGKQTLRPGEISVSEKLAGQGIIGESEFELLELIGAAYLSAKKLGIEFDEDHADRKECERIVSLALICDREDALRNGNDVTYDHFVVTAAEMDEKGDLHPRSKYEIIGLNSLREITAMKAYLDKMSKIVARDEKVILDKLKKLEAQKVTLLGKPKTAVRSRLKAGENNGRVTGKPKKQK